MGFKRQFKAYLQVEASLWRVTDGATLITHSTFQCETTADRLTTPAGWGSAFSGDPRQEKTHQFSSALTFPCRGLRCAGSPSCCAPSTGSARPGIWSSAASKPRAAEEQTDGGETVRKDIHKQKNITAEMLLHSDWIYFSW